MKQKADRREAPKQPPKHEGFGGCSLQKMTMIFIGKLYGEKEGNSFYERDNRFYL